MISKVIQRYRDLNKIRGKQIKLQHVATIETEYSAKIQRKLEKQEQSITDKLNKLAMESIRPADIVFVSFQNASEAHAIHKRARMSLLHKKIGCLFGNSRFIVNKNLFWEGKKLIKVGFAPEPTDILWENLGIQINESEE